MVRSVDLLQTEKNVKKAAPRAVEAVEAAAPAVPIPTEDGTAHPVLVMTPDLSTLRLIGNLLREVGCVAELASDAAEAVVKIRERHPVLVVADVSPTWTEAVVVRRVLRDTTPIRPLPFIVLASRVQFRELFGATPQEHEWAVERPLNPDAFRAAVHAALSKGGVGGCGGEASRGGAGRQVETAPDSEEPLGIDDDGVRTFGEDGNGEPVTYGQAVEAVRAAIRAPDSGEHRLMTDAQGAAKSVAESLTRGERILVHVFDRNQPFDLANHCANVSVLCVKIGQGLSYSSEELEKLAFVGLVHDLGMCRIPTELLMKEGTLDSNEAELIKTHPDHGKEIICSFGEEFEWVSDIVRQEHERENGTGYPLGIVGTEIHEFAKIIAVADIFEAFSHPRAFRKTFVSNEALQKVIDMRGKFCSARIIKALMNQITMFPLGSYVQLNTGEIGTVVGVNRTNVLSPSVRIVYGSDGARLSRPRVVSLNDTPSIFVVRPLAEEDLPDATTTPAR